MKADDFVWGALKRKGKDNSLKSTSSLTHLAFLSFYSQTSSGSIVKLIIVFYAPTHVSFH